MGKFILDNFYVINEGIIVLAGITAVLSYPKFKNSRVKYFIYFLIYIVFIELMGYYPRYSENNSWLQWIPALTKDTRFERNLLWYTVFWNIGSALFVTFYFFKILENKRFKTIIKFGGILFLFISFLRLMFNVEGYFTNQRDMFILIGGMIQIMLCIMLYFYEILMSDKIIAFYKSFHFYVAAAFFIWFLVMTPIAFYQKYYNVEDEAFVNFRKFLILFCNVLMYLTFIIALIKCKPQSQLKENITTNT
ncbi:hypothetical protein LRR18_14385 [Mangrovimonas sp. AS39]|uniref:hypothetical protein n=1 Tax=Mangrovimonas futianensis TaxID=2895523 RepID=UPI001E3FACCC|nr:hypothetical protein [Mangrovimonas futianensis]MCF1192779.1 hypothetical protein [Mangrovimonas futianensis]MCF1196301.1 hypothetical protein [Mangrovimonas futianensis]